MSNNNYNKNNKFNNKTFDKFEKKQFKPYRGKVNIENLSIRTNPSSKASKIPGFLTPGFYTIYKEENGYGCIDKDDKRWISLKYVNKEV